MKKLVKTDRSIPWLPSYGEGRLYVSDELPPVERRASAFGFVFEGHRILLTRLRNRDWDIPGGSIEPGETPEEAAKREVWEETYSKVAIVELVGIQELDLSGGPKPEKWTWPYPVSVQIFYLCRLVELRPFKENKESTERRLFSPEEARAVPTMINHNLLFEEALRRL